MTERASATREGKEVSVPAKLMSLACLAGINVERHWVLPNDYWPDTPDYAEVRRKEPWVLLQTRWGMVKLGWRKRVIEIDWTDTEVRGEVTTDDVTKGPTMVHAWSYEKAVGYLGAWKVLAESRVASAARSITTDESYPGIAHDLETMRAALTRLCDLKTMKEALEAQSGAVLSLPGGPVGRAGIALYYENNKEAAWQQARDALKNAAPQGKHRADAQATSGPALCDPMTTGEGAVNDCPAPAGAAPCTAASKVAHGATPRTDAAQAEHWRAEERGSIIAPSLNGWDFARQLERELADMIHQRDYYADKVNGTPLSATKAYTHLYCEPCDEFVRGPCSLDNCEQKARADSGEVKP